MAKQRLLGKRCRSLPYKEQARTKGKLDLLDSVILNSGDARFFAIRDGRADIAGLFPTRNPISPTGLRIALKIVQLCGLFRIARLITSNGLRILCYHGFALADE